MVRKCLFRELIQTATVFCHAATAPKPFGRGTGQGRPNTEFPCFVAGGTHDAALGRRRTYNHRFATQGRIVSLLHGGVERIHVEMEDNTVEEDSQKPTESRSHFLSGQFNPQRT